MNTPDFIALLLSHYIPTLGINLSTVRTYLLPVHTVPCPTLSAVLSLQFTPRDRLQTCVCPDYGAALETDQIAVHRITLA